MLAEPGSYFTCRVGDVPVVVVRDRDGRAARVRQRLPPPRRRGRVRRRAAARRCSATTTRGPTGSTARCAPRRAPATRTSTASELGLRPVRRRHLGAVHLRQRRRGRRAARRRRSARCRTSCASAASTSTRCGSTTASTTASTRTGRSRSRTTSSATTAPSPTRASARSSTCARTSTSSRATRRSPATTATRATGDGAGPVPPRLAGAQVQRHAGGLPNLSIGPMWPVAPRPHRRLPRLLLRPRGDARSGSTTFLELDDQVGAEDAVLVASVQRGMASGVFEDGRLLLPSEQLIAAFQAWVTAGVRSSGARTGSPPA